MSLKTVEYVLTAGMQINAMKKLMSWLHWIKSFSAVSNNYFHYQLIGWLFSQ